MRKSGGTSELIVASDELSWRAERHAQNSLDRNRAYFRTKVADAGQPGIDLRVSVILRALPERTPFWSHQSPVPGSKTITSGLRQWRSGLAEPLLTSSRK